MLRARQSGSRASMMARGVAKKGLAHCMVLAAPIFRMHAETQLEHCTTTNYNSLLDFACVHGHEMSRNSCGSCVVEALCVELIRFMALALC